MGKQKTAGQGACGGDDWMQSTKKGIQKDYRLLHTGGAFNRIAATDLTFDM
jgi:hypothetical protein